MTTTDDTTHQLGANTTAQAVNYVWACQHFLRATGRSHRNIEELAARENVSARTMYRWRRSYTALGNPQ